MRACRFSAVMPVGIPDLVVEKTSLIYEAFSIMKTNNITQLLVVHENTYVGVIHLHDILKHDIF